MTAEELSDSISFSCPCSEGKFPKWNSLNSWSVAHQTQFYGDFVCVLFHEKPSLICFCAIISFPNLEHIHLPRSIANNLRDSLLAYFNKTVGALPRNKSIDDSYKNILLGGLSSQDLMYSFLLSFLVFILFLHRNIVSFLLFM